MHYVNLLCAVTLFVNRLLVLCFSSLVVFQQSTRLMACCDWLGWNRFIWLKYAVQIVDVSIQSDPSVSRANVPPSEKWWRTRWRENNEITLPFDIGRLILSTFTAPLSNGFWKIYCTLSKMSCQHLFTIFKRKKKINNIKSKQRGRNPPTSAWKVNDKPTSRSIKVGTLEWSARSRFVPRLTSFIYFYFPFFGSSSPIFRWRRRRVHKKTK